jgi:thiosulfate/3-mercaptopyruvate sulfurtransferase
MDAYEISNDDHIIIYGRESVFFTPRIWFMLKSFGHNPARLHLMQGSYEEWVQKGGEIETEEKRVDEPKDIFKKIEQSTSQFQYKARVNPSYIFSMNDVSNNLDSEEENKSIIVDSRGSSYVKGNIPNSIHIPYKTLVDSNNSLKLKSKDELLAIFDDAGIDPLISRTIICTCGTGVSACSVFLALVQCGRDVDNGSTFMYDGSWSEWGKESATPKERNKLK